MKETGIIEAIVAAGEKIEKLTDELCFVKYDRELLEKKYTELQAEFKRLKEEHEHIG